MTSTLPTGKIFNLLFGLSILSWGILGMVFVKEPYFFTPVCITVSAIHFTVGTLVILRKPIRKHGDWTSIAGSLPGFLVGGVAMTLTPVPANWPIYAQYVFVLGGALVILSFLTLGNNFSIFPGLRTITRFGVYRYIRHPAYTGELILIMACVLTTPPSIAIPFLIAATGAIALRVLVEEHFLLQTAPQYKFYSRHVRWRLIPYIW